MKRRKVLLLAASVLGILCITFFVLFKTGVIKFNKPRNLSERFLSSAKPGDEFILGKYEQDNDLENGKEDIELLSYDDLAYMILAETNKKYKITDLFKKVCDYKGLSDAVFENKIIFRKKIAS